jgi:ABC-2 type transport system permease protein
VLNCVDALAGDETFIELRKKRPRHRTLTALEAESVRFIEQSQAEQRKAEETANEQLEQARTRLREAVDKIRNSTELDQRTKESMVRYREQVEQRRLTLIEQDIQDRKGQAIRESKDRQEEAIRAIQHRIGAQAAVLTPLPALLLGGLVFFIRNRRENQGANPDRLA